MEEAAEALMVDRLERCLELAVGAGSVAAAAALLASGRLDVNRTRESPGVERVPNLVFAVYLGHLEVFKLLLAAGADPNRRDFSGRSPLYYAIRYAEGPEFLSALLTCGRPEIVAPELNSPSRDILDFILRHRRDSALPFVRALLVAGVDPNRIVATRKGHISPFWLALTTKAFEKETHRVQLLDLLLAAGLRVDAFERCLLCKILTSPPGAVIPGLAFSGPLHDWYHHRHAALHTVPTLATLAAHAVRTQPPVRRAVGIHFDRVHLPAELREQLALARF